MRRRTRSWPLVIGAAALTGVLCALAAAALRGAGAGDAASWATLRTAMDTLRQGGGVAACDAVTEPEARLDCLQYAASVALQRRDVAAVRAACAGMAEPAWRQSCVMDALAIDPTLDLVGYVAACEADTPLYAFHCETHARNRMEARDDELPLVAEAHPDQLARVFPVLVNGHTDAENVVTARAFGARLRASGRPVTDCDGLDALLKPPCVAGWGG